MSEEDVKVVRRSYEAFMRGDGEAALSAYSPMPSGTTPGSDRSGGGQITRTVVYSNPAEAVEAAGLSE